MDHAVALVETYLRLNGFFTVSEYPVIRPDQSGDFRTVTDLDLLAFRFPGVDRGRTAQERGGSGSSGAALFIPDPELSVPGDEPQMLIGEVKEGRAELNEAAADPAVLEAALTRFGCCAREHIPGVVRSLLRDGQAKTHCGHLVRVVAFGSLPSANAHARHKTIFLGHVENFLRDFIRLHWDALHSAQFKDFAFGFLVMQEKARRGRAGLATEERTPAERVERYH